MGQAKRRGSFEQRMEQSQKRREAEMLAEKEYWESRRKTPTKVLPMMPLYAAMMMANTFPYDPNGGGPSCGK